MNDILNQHERIALQFSGGKDSLACLYLLREHWDKITVYWLDTGDAFPEALEVIERVKQEVPRFVRVESSSRAVIEQFGLPTDIVPASCTPMGIEASGSGVLMQDKFSCCLRTMMIPMHQRMLADGITLIIRGQKSADTYKGALRSGDIEGGMQCLYPLQDWTDEQVHQYLECQCVEPPAFYARGMRSMPDCMTCSGWWDEGRAAYLNQWHPVHFQEYQSRLNTISDAVGGHIAAFNREVAQ